MKFYTTPYHYNLIKDKDRLAVFLEGIDEFFNDNVREHNKKLGFVLDVGCGSGVLSYFASKYFDHVIAIDIDSKIVDCAKQSFDKAKIENVNFINGDASSYQFDKFNDFDESVEFNNFVDLIICEMLDTALIDEEEVLVLKNIKKYLKNDGKIIPQGIINIAEPVYMEKDYIHYEDVDYHGKKPKYKVLGKPVKFAEFDFLKDLDPDFETTIDFIFKNINNNINNINNANDKNSNKFNDFNGIKITTFTKINENIICGPTPMFNPPLFIPVDVSKQLNGKINSNEISVKLEYVMGGGLGTIKTSILLNNDK